MSQALADRADVGSGDDAGEASASLAVAGGQGEAWDPPAAVQKQIASLNTEL